MFGCAFVGMLAGFLPKATGRREVALLAVYGSVSGYLFGFLLNLAFDLATSLGWDTGRAVTNFVCICLAGPAVLTVFRRAARKARFHALRFSSRKVPTADEAARRAKP